jgi:hypothetical protein
MRADRRRAKAAGEPSRKLRAIAQRVGRAHVPNAGPKGAHPVGSARTGLRQRGRRLSAMRTVGPHHPVAVRSSGAPFDRSRSGSPSISRGIPPRGQRPLIGARVEDDAVHDRGRLQRAACAPRLRRSRPRPPGGELEDEPVGRWSVRAIGNRRMAPGTAGAARRRRGATFPRERVQGGGGRRASRSAPADAGVEPAISPGIRCAGCACASGRASARASR